MEEEIEAISALILSVSSESKWSKVMAGYKVVLKGNITIHLYSSNAKQAWKDAESVSYERRKGIVGVYFGNTPVNKPKKLYT